MPGPTSLCLTPSSEVALAARTLTPTRSVSPCRHLKPTPSLSRSCLLRCTRSCMRSDNLGPRISSSELGPRISSGGEPGPRASAGGLGSQSAASGLGSWPARLPALGTEGFNSSSNQALPGLRLVPAGGAPARGRVSAFRLWASSGSSSQPEAGSKPDQRCLCISPSLSACLGIAVVAAGAAAVLAASCREVAEEYKVQRGDTLWRIAQKVGVSVDDLIAANPWVVDHVEAREVLRIPRHASVGLGSGVGQFSAQLQSAAAAVGRAVRPTQGVASSAGPGTESRSAAGPGTEGATSTDAPSRSLPTSPAIAASTVSKSVKELVARVPGREVGQRMIVSVGQAVTPLVPSRVRDGIQTPEARLAALALVGGLAAVALFRLVRSWWEGRVEDEEGEGSNGQLEGAVVDASKTGPVLKLEGLKRRSAWPALKTVDLSKQKTRRSAKELEEALVAVEQRERATVEMEERRREEVEQLRRSHEITVKALKEEVLMQVKAFEDRVHDVQRAAEAAEKGRVEAAAARELALTTVAKLEANLDEVQRSKGKLAVQLSQLSRKRGRGREGGVSPAEQVEKMREELHTRRHEAMVAKEIVLQYMDDERKRAWEMAKLHQIRKEVHLHLEPLLGRREEEEVEAGHIHHLLGDREAKEPAEESGERAERCTNPDKLLAAMEVAVELLEEWDRDRDEGGEGDGRVSRMQYEAVAREMQAVRAELEHMKELGAEEMEASANLAAARNELEALLNVVGALEKEVQDEAEKRREAIERAASKAEEIRVLELRLSEQSTLAASLQDAQMVGALRLRATEERLAQTQAELRAAAEEIQQLKAHLAHVGGDGQGLLPGPVQETVRDGGEAIAMPMVVGSLATATASSVQGLGDGEPNAAGVAQKLQHWMRQQVGAVIGRPGTGEAASLTGAGPVSNGAVKGDAETLSTLRKLEVEADAEAVLYPKELAVAEENKEEEAKDRVTRMLEMITFGKLVKRHT